MKYFEERSIEQIQNDILGRNCNLPNAQKVVQLSIHISMCEVHIKELQEEKKNLKELNIKMAKKLSDMKKEMDSLKLHMVPHMLTVEQTNVLTVEPQVVYCDGWVDKLLDP